MNAQVKAIRSEIERMKKDARKNAMVAQRHNNTPVAAVWSGKENACIDLLSFIDSLPEEKGKTLFEEIAGVGLDVTDFCKPVDPGIAKYIADHWWEMLDNEETGCPKESDDLEKAARLYAIPRYMRDVDVNYLEEYPYDKIAEAGFIAGAKWQKEQDDKDLSKKIAAAYQLGLANKEKQMMKEAVEGKVFMSFAPGHNQMVMADVDLPTNTKVKLIILPNE